MYVPERHTRDGSEGTQAMTTTAIRSPLPAWCDLSACERRDLTNDPKTHPGDFHTTQLSTVEHLGTSRGTVLKVRLEHSIWDDGHNEGARLLVDGDDGSGMVCQLDVPGQDVEGLVRAILDLVQLVPRRQESKGTAPVA